MTSPVCAHDSYFDHVSNAYNLSPLMQSCFSVSSMLVVVSLDVLSALIALTLVNPAIIRDPGYVHECRQYDVVQVKPHVDPYDLCFYRGSWIFGHDHASNPWVGPWPSHAHGHGQCRTSFQVITICENVLHLCLLYRVLCDRLRGSKRLSLQHLATSTVVDACHKVGYVRFYLRFPGTARLCTSRDPGYNSTVSSDPSPNL
jgi:hypothetical protein